MACGDKIIANYINLVRLFITEKRKMERSHCYIIVLSLLLLAVVPAIFLSVNTSSLTGLAAAEPVAPMPLATEESVNLLKTQVNQLQQEITLIQSTAEANDQEIKRLNGNIQSLNAQLSQLQQTVDGKINSISTGLAGLQTEVKSTQNDLSQVRASSARKNILLAVLILLILAATSCGIYFYQKGFFNSRTTSQPAKMMMDFITRQIKQGKKFPQIKQALLQAGWKDEQIKEAYQATMNQNYQQYQKKNYSDPLDNLDKDKIKILGIIGILVIVTIIIVFLIYRSSATGQAYQFYGGVADYEEGTGLNRDITQQQCFPPRLFIQGVCCDDRNQNNVCDSSDGYQETALATYTGTLYIRPASPQDIVHNQQIIIDSQGFNPSPLNATRGDVVNFVNQRQESVRIIPGTGCPPMNSGLIAPGNTFTWVPVNPGICSVTLGTGTTGEACADNSQCANGRSCVDNQCQFIADLYQTNNCGEYCTVIRVKVATFNVDSAGNDVQQNYTLRMGLGSYTGGGALDWTIQPMPDFCKPSSASRIHQESNTWRADIAIPFELREFNNGNLLSARTETVNTRQQKAISHSQLNLNQFRLQVQDVHLTCGGQTVFG